MADPLASAIFGVVLWVAMLYFVCWRWFRAESELNQLRWLRDTLRLVAGTARLDTQSANITLRALAYNPDPLGEALSRLAVEGEVVAASEFVLAKTDASVATTSFGHVLVPILIFGSLAVLAGDTRAAGLSVGFGLLAPLNRFRGTSYRSEIRAHLEQLLRHL